LKDTRSPKVVGTERQAAFDIYKMTCELKGRQKLTCEDFIETLRKHHLDPGQAKLQTAMQRREAELALYVREGLLAQGQAVPDEIEQVFQAMKRQAAAQPEGGEKTAQMPARKKARL
jgi:hypothetical protein